MITRRGNLFDIVFIITSLFVIGITAFVALTFINTTHDALNAEESIPQEAKDVFAPIHDDAPWVIDFILLMTFISMPLGSAVLAFINDIPPFMFIASIGICLFAVFLASGYGQALERVLAINDVGESLPMTSYITENAAVYAVFVIALVAFGVYVKSRGEYG